MRWLIALLPLAAALVLAWLAGNQGDSRATWVIRGMVLAVSAPPCLAWAALIGLRCRWRIRFLLAGLVLAPLALGAALLRLDGVGGDLQPLLRWRWSSTSTAEVRLRTQNSQPVVAERDWPGFRGSRRSGRTPSDWQPHQGMNLLWRAGLGSGFSGCAVTGDLVLTLEQDGGEEVLLGLELGSGMRRWRCAWPGSYATTLGGVGPRATPTLADDRVVACGAQGTVLCAMAGSGRERWRRNLTADGGQQPEWAYSASPWFGDGRVVLPAGGEAGVLAYRLEDGDLLWQTGPVGPLSYSSPILWQNGGRRLLLVLMGTRLLGLDEHDGRIRLDEPWPGAWPKVATPVLLTDGGIVLAAGYGLGGRCLDLRWDDVGQVTATERWASPGLRCKFSDAVLGDDALFALDDGWLVAVDPATGRQRWRYGERLGHGQLLLAGATLLVNGENDCTLRAIETHDGTLRGSWASGGPERPWNAPHALAGRFLLIRDAGGVACYELGPARVDDPGVY